MSKTPSITPTPTLIMPPSRTSRGKALRKKGVCGLAAVGRACGRPLTTGKSADRKLAEYKKRGIVKRLSKGGVTSMEMAAMLKYEGVSWEDVTTVYVDNGLKTVKKLIKAPFFFKGTRARTFIIRSAKHYITVTANNSKKQVKVFDQRGKIPIENLKNYRIRTILRVLSRGDVACKEVSGSDNRTPSEDESSEDFDDSSEDESVSDGASPVYKPKMGLGSSSDGVDTGKASGDKAGQGPIKRDGPRMCSDSGSSSDDGDTGMGCRGKFPDACGVEPKRYGLDTSSDSGSSSDDDDTGKSTASRGKLLHSDGARAKRYGLDTSSDSGSSSDDDDTGKSAASRGKLLHSDGARAKRYKLGTGCSRPGPTSPIPEARVPANLGKSPCRTPMDTDTRPGEKTTATVSRDDGMDTESDPEHQGSAFSHIGRRI